MTLTLLNRLPLHDARAKLLECGGSAEWADRLLALRPFPNQEHLFTRAEEIWWNLDESAWLDAFSRHPQIGAREALSTWSSEEQAGMNHASVATALDLHDLNRDYLQKFGWTFIICATGKSAEEMHSALVRRLGNGGPDEIRVAAAEQAKIMRIRLRKLVEL